MTRVSIALIKRGVAFQNKQDIVIEVPYSLCINMYEPCYNYNSTKDVCNHYFSLYTSLRIFHFTPDLYPESP